MTVRRLRSGDESLWSAAVAAIISEEDRDQCVASAQDIARGLADARCYAFVATEEGHPAGLLCAYRFPNVVAGGEIVYLYDIEVSARHRRRGIGSALVRALTTSCDSEGVGLIWAGTDVRNVAARRTFEATGAELEGESYAEYEWDLEND